MVFFVILSLILSKLIFPDGYSTSAKIGVKQSWASSLPSLNMSLGYNATSSDQVTKQYFEDNYIKSANLTLSIPLFNGFRQRNDIKISKLQLSQEQASYSSAIKDAEVDLYSLLNLSLIHISEPTRPY